MDTDAEKFHGRKNRRTNRCSIRHGLERLFPLFLSVLIRVDPWFNCNVPAKCVNPGTIGWPAKIAPPARKQSANMRLCGTDPFMAKEIGNVGPRTRGPGPKVRCGRPEIRKL